MRVTNYKTCLHLQHFQRKNSCSSRNNSICYGGCFLSIYAVFWGVKEAIIILRFCESCWIWWLISSKMWWQLAMIQTNTTGKELDFYPESAEKFWGEHVILVKNWFSISVLSPIDFSRYEKFRLGSQQNLEWKTE